MKDALFIVVFGVLIYLGFSTLFGDSELMGSYGAVFASYNHTYFGYISFIYLFALLAPLYFFYKNTNFDFRKSELAMVSFLFLFSLLIAQGLLIESEFRGKFGADFVDFLSPYIGLFGLWVFWFIITFVSIVIVLDKDTSEILNSIYNFIRKKSSSLLSNKGLIHIEEPLDEIQVTKETPLIIQEIERTVDEVEVIQDEIAELEKPAFIRRKKAPSVETVQKEEIIVEKKEKKPKNILDIAEETKENKNTIVVEELEENAKLLASMEKGKVEKPKNFTLPSVDFLQKPTAVKKNLDESELDDKIRYLIEKLAHFKIDGDVVRTYAGPVVSTFEFKPAANVKVSKILSLQDDLAMALSAETIRIQAPIPGKDVVGIEIPLSLIHI